MSASILGTWFFWSLYVHPPEIGRTPSPFWLAHILQAEKPPFAPLSYTPENERLEPENHPFEKEKHLPHHHSWGSTYYISGVYVVLWSLGLHFLVVKNTSSTSLRCFFFLAHFAGAKSCFVSSRSGIFLIPKRPIVLSCGLRYTS